MSSPQNPDPRALELITQHQRALYGYIYSLVFSENAADVILQETNLVLCRKVHEFDPDGQATFLTWACRIAYLETLAYRGRVRRDKLVMADDDLLERLSARALDTATEADVRLPLLRECVDELSSEQRQLIEDRYGTDVSVAALAKARGRSEGSISVTIHRIRRRLFDCIERKLASSERG
ncbi:MAG: sigma-70 family RNA polymerase sigma factor [Pirellulales bacterium]|nr:sigma-70 family RNA polymerase sigma factor [Pirellulales bacterium]